MEFLNRFLLNGPDFQDAIISILLAAIIGLLISRLYTHTHRGLSYEHTFVAALVLLAPIVSVVMLYIRGDLVLSLGLIGSLSIVRFRTAVKDTRDMVFLFWVIAVGLGAGTYNWGIVVISSFMIMLLVAVLFFVRYGQSVNTDFVLVLSGRTPFQSDPSRDNTIQRRCIEARLRSLEIRDTQWEIVYELHLIETTGQNTETFISELKALPGVTEVSLLAPQLSLPL